MKIKKTKRGFSRIEFKDHYGVSCSLQKSSLATKDAIWFGVNDAEPKILASKVMENGTGWVKYSIPEDVSLNTRMHLTRKQVAKLLPFLQKFMNTGEID